MPTTPSSKSDDHKLGSLQAITDWDGNLEVTVLSYKQPVAKSAPHPDNRACEHGSLLAKVCNADDHTQTVNTTPFRLVTYNVESSITDDFSMTEPAVYYWTV